MQFKALKKILFRVRTKNAEVAHGEGFPLLHLTLTVARLHFLETVRCVVILYCK